MAFPPRHLLSFFRLIKLCCTPASGSLCSWLLCAWLLSKAVQGGGRYAGREQMAEQVDPSSSLEEREGRTHCLLAAFSPCPLTLRKISLATAHQAPSLSAPLPRNSPLALQAHPTAGDASLCYLHGKPLVLQEALRGPQLCKHSRPSLLLCVEVCWGRRLRHKMAMRMEGGDGRRTHLG